MKKIYTLFIVLTVLMSSTLIGHAWDINNSDLGMSFTISNNWTETGYIGNTLSFKNTADTSEQISIFSTDVGAYSITYDEFLNACSDGYSDYNISANIINMETGQKYYPTITSLNVRHETVTYNGIKYYNYLKEYKSSRYGYKTGYGLISSFITVQNGKLYEIVYNLYENDQETMGRKYYDSEIFKILGNLSYAPGEIKIYVNGSRIYPDSAPVIVSGRTLVPIRAVAEALGYKVSWDPNQQLVGSSSANRIRCNP